MKTWTDLSFSEKIRWRIRLLWLLFIAMLIYMIVVSELGGGDSRMMTRLAETVSGILFFGGFIVIGRQICYNKQLLNNKKLLREKYLNETDERNHYLHDKSGGAVVDILLFLLVFTTVTCALFNMAAFYVSLSILAVTVLLKGIVYYIHSKMY